MPEHGEIAKRIGESMAMSPHQQISSMLDALRAGYSERYIVCEMAPIGLGGQISGRINALLAGLATGRGVVFLHDDDPPYTQSFVPMGVEKVGTVAALVADMENCQPLVLDRAQDEVMVRLQPFNSNLGHESAQAKMRARIAELVGEPDISLAFVKGLVKRWMMLEPALNEAIMAKVTALGISERTIGVHVRRGDKQVETAFLPLKAIEQKVAEIARTGDFDSVFVASDSEAVINSFQCPPNTRLIVDREEKRYNNANHKMLHSRSDIAVQETITAIFNIEALSACGGLVGQDNAHFAILSADVILSRGAKQAIYLFPGNYLEMRSPWVRVWFKARRRARALARKMFPWATLQGRTQKG